MIRIFLIASVAALAITAPAQAQRGDSKDDREAARAEAQAQRAKARGGEQRGQARAQRVEAPQREQRVQMERPQRQQRVQVERPQRQQRVQEERPQRQQRVQTEQPQRQQRVQMERPQRQQRVQMERPQRQQRVQVERPQRQQRVQMERPQREQRVRQQQTRAERIAKTQNRPIERRALADRRSNVIEARGQQQLRQQDRQAQRIDRRDAQASQRVRLADIRNERRVRPQATVGQRLNLRNQQVSRDWYNNYAEQRGRTFYNSSPDYFYDYNYNDGYLYQVNRNNNLVTGLFPLLGGAFGVGRPLPIGYDSYNVPYGYRSLYYDTPDYYYRYGDGGIYRVDRDTQLIQAVAALLTGQSLGIGQRLPLGYDVYNVPYGYRDQYYDTNSMWYRYDDGTIYGVDPYSRMIQSAYPVSYGYNVGYPVPAYASYGGYNDYGYGGYGDYGYGGYSGYSGYSGYAGYGVPYGYRDLYYAAPGYNYQYANGGIYQVDPSTQLVRALVALVTGTNLGVGQVLPLGYDAYNVPYAYRSSYYDTPDAWYRYDDGTIYQVDPRTRIIQTSIPVSYNGYAVGYPMPAYAGYAVPSSYSDLYYAQPGYDYRYLNGGIYQVDPDTRMVRGVAALLTGTNLGVGQRLPMGYDAYNVPIAYRSTYRDTPDAWYRYNDGYIYRVDPQTRVIRARIDGIA